MTKRVQWRGVTTDERTAAMAEAAAKLTGPEYVVDPTQGSYSGSVSASAGTHDGGGALDIHASTLSSSQRQEIVKAFRRVGFAAWLRTPSQSNWPYHIHAIAVQPGGRNDRGVLSSGAHNQVKDYYDNRNGLASKGRDDGPRDWVGVTWEKYREQEDTMTVWQKYSGKPTGTLDVPEGDYVTIDVDVPDPGFAGLESHMLYINVDPVWRLPQEHPEYRHQQAVVRTRYKREGGDNTAYNDRLITPAAESWLITDGDHWEQGEKGQGGRWQIKVSGDVTKIVLGTRYCKTASVK